MKIEDQNRSKGFVEKLKGHSQFLKITSRKFKDLRLQMDKAEEDGNREEYGRLIAQGDEIAKLGDKTTKEFETKYKKELRDFESLFGK